MKAKGAWLGLLATLVFSTIVSYHSPQGTSGSGCILLLSVIFLFGALAMVDSQQQGVSGFPSFLYQLPIDDRELVFWPMAVSAVLLSLLGLLISTLVLGSTISFRDTWWLAPYLSATGVLFQATSWAPMKRPELRVTMNFVTVAAIVSGPMAMGFGFIRPILLAAIYTAILLASIVLTVQGVSKVRHGLATAGVTDADYVAPDLPPFRSRVQTQSWLEEKRNGLVMKVLSGMFLALFGGLSLFTVFHSPDPIIFRTERLPLANVALAGLSLLLIPVFAYGGCCGSEQDNLTKDRGMNPFMALRPLTDIQIIQAKIWMAGKVTGQIAMVQILVAIAILLVPVSLEGHRQSTFVSLLHVLSAREFLGILGLFAFFVLLGIKNSALGIWCALGRLPLTAVMLVSMVPFGVVIGGLMWSVTHPESLPKLVAYLPWAVWIYGGVKLAALVGSTVKLRQMKLIPDALIVKWFVGCLVAGVLLFGVGCLVIPSNIYSRPALLAQVFCILPLVRMVWAPMFIHRGRHR